MKSRNRSGSAFHRFVVAVFQRPLFVWVLGVAALSLSACGGEFEPYERLSGPRILAIQADPPVLTPGMETALSALVHLPEGSLADWAWSFCPLTQGRQSGYACALDEATLAQALGDAGSGFSFELGQSEEVSFSFPGDAETLERMCLGLVEAGVPLPGGEAACEAGFEVTIRLDITVDGETYSAIKGLNLSGLADFSLGENPLIDGLVLADTNDTSFELLGDSDYPLRALIPEDAAERYTPLPSPFEPNPLERSERLILSWFVTSGTLETSRTAFIDGSASRESLINNIWSPGDSEGGEERIYLVLRDERGGVSWWVQDARVEVSP